MYKGKINLVGIGLSFVEPDTFSDKVWGCEEYKPVANFNYRENTDDILIDFRDYSDSAPGGICDFGSSIGNVDYEYSDHGYNLYTPDNNTENTNKDPDEEPDNTDLENIILLSVLANSGLTNSELSGLSRRYAC